MVRIHHLPPLLFHKGNRGFSQIIQWFFSYSFSESLRFCAFTVFCVPVQTDARKSITSQSMPEGRGIVCCPKHTRKARPAQASEARRASWRKLAGYRHPANSVASRHRGASRFGGHSTSPPTLAALGVGCRERVRQGWPDASHPALRSGLPAATGFALRHAHPARCKAVRCHPEGFRLAGGRESCRHGARRGIVASVRQMRTLLFLADRPRHVPGGGQNHVCRLRRESRLSQRAGFW
jgi:hypothetical protein